MLLLLLILSVSTVIIYVCIIRSIAKLESFYFHSRYDCLQMAVLAGIAYTTVAAVSVKHHATIYVCLCVSVCLSVCLSLSLDFNACLFYTIILDLP